MGSFRGLWRYVAAPSLLVSRCPNAKSRRGRLKLGPLGEVFFATPVTFESTVDALADAKNDSQGVMLGLILILDDTRR